MWRRALVAVLFIGCGDSQPSVDGGVESDATAPPIEAATPVTGLGFVCDDAGSHACDCPPDAGCTDTCSNGGCKYTCESASTCSETCGGSCQATCNGSKSCSMTCGDGGGCTQDCTAATCVMECPGGGCTLTCHNAQTCHTTKCGGNCTVACNGAPDCSCVGTGCGITP